MENGTPNAGETATPKAPENGTPPQAPVTGNASDSASEVEKLRKERDQAQMRANQLEKEKKQREEAEAARHAKELEEQNEFKTLFEQEKARREKLEADREAEERLKELAKTRTDVTKEYSDEVKAEAEELGITLNSVDEADIASYKEKLDKIQKRVGTTGKVGPNNPGRPSAQPQPSQDELRMQLKDPAKFAEVVSKRPGIAMMMRQS